MSKNKLDKIKKQFTWTEVFEILYVLAIRSAFALFFWKMMVFFRLPSFTSKCTAKSWGKISQELLKLHSVE